MKADINIIRKGLVSFSNRIDADFYMENFISFEKDLQQKPNKKFSEICKESNNKADPSRDPDKYFKYLEITGINLLDGSIYPQEILGEEAPSRARKKCVENDLLISTVRPNRNAVAIFKGTNYNNLVCTTGFCVFTTIADLSPEEVFIFLKSKYAIIQLSRRMRATMYPAVANVDICDLTVPLFSKKMATKIAYEMRKVFQLRKEVIDLNEQIDLMVEEFCNSIFPDFDLETYATQKNIKIIKRSEIFSEANRIDAEFYKEVFDVIDSGLDKHKNTMPLGKFFSYVSTGKTPSKAEYAEPEESDFAIVKVGTLTDMGINWSNVEFVTQEFFDKNNKFNIKERDILLTSSAHSMRYIGRKVNVVGNIPQSHKEKCLFVGEIMVLRSEGKPEIDPYYVASFLRSYLGKIQILRCIRGISAHIYNIDIPKYVRIPLPKNELIYEIAKISKKVEMKNREAISKVTRLAKEYENEIGI